MWLKKTEPQHYFEVDSEKIEDSNFEGKLIKISPSEYEYEGSMRQTMKLLFIDEAHEYFQLDSSYNMLSRWLINSLLGYIDSMKNEWHNKWIINLELSLWINKDNYKQMGVKINGERSSWKYDVDTQRSMIQTLVKGNGTKENDYFKYDEVLKKWIEEIQNFLEVTDFIDQKEKAYEPAKELDLDDYIDSINMEDDTSHIDTLEKECAKLNLSSSQKEFLKSAIKKRKEKLTNPAKSNRLPTEAINIEDIPF